MACRSALKNIKFTQALVDVIKEAGVTEGCPKAKGNLLYTTASKVSDVPMKALESNTEAA